MAHQNGSNREPRASEEHARWVREHPQIEEAAFPEYPDDPKRRGSSRGAMPNGNPWRPVDPDESPGRGEASEFCPDTLRTGTARPNPQSPAAPVPRAPGSPTLRPAAIMAVSDADARVGHAIGEVLAQSKSLEGMHLIVEVVATDVYLRGVVRDRAVKSEVEQLCSTVSGVGRIHNELDVGN
jgi:hypothetical protein